MYIGGMDSDDVFALCQDCGSEISGEEFDRTGTDDYCESCPEMCCDPRSKADGCECENV